jgi:methyltransferase family protein
VTDDPLLLHFSTVRRRVAKWTHFLPIYDRLLSQYRGRSLTLVEVGVGDGGSLEAWRSYLGPSARIVGIDLEPAAKRLESDGFEIIIGDQADPEFWAQHLPNVGPIDVLIDDGGHTSVQQIVTVACAVPHVRNGGVIVVEDTHTSYMPKQYPGAGRFGFMQFAQHVVDVLHVRNDSVTEPVADTAGLGRAIHSVQFFESLVVFYVDRRLCGPSEEFEAGADELSPEAPAAGTLRSRAIDALESQPRWIRWLLQPARRVIGIALRASRRITDTYRVRRYFR